MSTTLGPKRAGGSSRRRSRPELQGRPSFPCLQTRQTPGARLMRLRRRKRFCRRAVNALAGSRTTTVGDQGWLRLPDSSLIRLGEAPGAGLSLGPGFSKMLRRRGDVGRLPSCHTLLAPLDVLCPFSSRLPIWIDLCSPGSRCVDNLLTAPFAAFVAMLPEANISRRGAIHCANAREFGHALVS
jgi:hypothetical protein